MRKGLLVLSALTILILSLALSSCHKHEFGEWQTTKEPNCSSEGTKERICASCKEKETEAIPVLTEGGHDFGQWHTDLEPTCSSIGTKSRDCKRCDEHEIENIDENKDNHISFGDWVTTLEPTCSADGKKERVCVCEYKETAIIPKLTEGGHTYGDWAISVEPTCSNEGQRIRYCLDCDAPQVETLSPVDEGGHSYGEWYTVAEPTCSAVGEKKRDCVYCDNKETEEIPVLTSGGHSFGEWSTVTEPTCSTEGERKRACILCGISEYEPISPLDEGGHAYGEWYETIKPTCDSEGERRKDCTLCDNFVTEILDKLPIVYTITVDIDGKETVINLPEDGIYSLSTPSKLGYTFLGFFEGDREFNASGVVTESKSITAKFQLSETKTFNELKTRIDGGVDKILLASDITLTDTIYVTGNTEITAKGNYTLTRDASFLGELFVLGEDNLGNNLILKDKKAALTIKPEGTITIDGNKDNLTDKVTGTVFFMTNGSVLNIYDGVTVQNHKKLGNEKILDTKYAFNGAITPGGSVVLIDDGTFNMYGGIITNNEVSPLSSSMTPEEDKIEGYENSTYGGAIYNNGTTNIYGGTISNNKGSYGGAIASGRVLNIEGGLFEGNSSTYYGGAVYQTNSATSVAYIGKESKDITVIFRNNSSITGGAIRTQYNSGTVIYGGTLFDSNKAISYIVTEDVIDEATGEPTGETVEVVKTAGKGGAIQSYGELIIYYAEFKNNNAMDRGGAISTNYSAEDMVPRVTLIHEAIFEGNSATFGGAIACGSDYNATTDAEIKLDKVTFIGNEATSNGGAIYLTAKSIASLIGASTFKNNIAGANGGTFYLTNTTTVQMLDSATAIIEGNTADYGGVAYLKTESTLTLKNASLIGNSARNGGAIYTTSSTVNLDGITAKENTATGLGAFVSATLSTVNLSSKSSASSISKNTAGSHGGAIYSLGSAINLVGTSENALVFDSNLASKQGGAIYLAASSDNNTTTRSSINASYVSFTSNTANQVVQYGGGALYCSNVVLKLDNIIFDGNRAIFGGAISLYSGSELTAEKITFTNNIADHQGGVMYTSKSTVSFKDITVKGNKATGFTATEDVIDEVTGELTGEAVEIYNEGVGGAFFFNSSSYAIFDTLNADGNIADNAGFIMINVSELEIKGESNTIKNSQAISGGYQKGGGAIRFSGSTGTIENTSFISNTALYGGAIGLFSNSDVLFKSCTFDGNKSILYDYATGDNTASQGGSLYINHSSAALDTCVIKNSSADNRGSAIYTTTGELKLTNTAITENTGTDSIIYLTKSTFESANSTYTNNTTKTGVIYINTSTVATMSGDTMSGNTASSHGGCIYIPNGTLTIDKLTALNNTSGDSGGAIHIASKGEAATTVTISNSSFTGNSVPINNESRFGGAIFIDNGAVATLTDVVFTKNIASNGGAIGLTGASLTINGITAIENEATGNSNYSGNGGAISIKKDSTNVKIEINAGTQITENTFTGNKASRAGGAIFFYLSEGEFSANQLTFTNNVATSNYGGALYLRATDSSLLTADIGTIVANGNKASGNGGALYLYKMTGSIDSVTASNNSANNGGAMYIAGSAVIEFGELYGSGNTAATNGGYAYIGTSKTTIHSGEIGENDDATGLELHVSVSKAAKINLSKFTFPDGGVNNASYIENIAE